MYKSFFFRISKKTHFVQFFISQIYYDNIQHKGSLTILVLQSYFIDDGQFILSVHFCVYTNKVQFNFHTNKH